MKSQILKRSLYLVAIFFVLSACFIAYYLIFENIYHNKIYPGVKLDNINLGGKTSEEAKTIIYQQINKINQNGIKFKYIDLNIENKNAEAIIKPTLSSLEGDLAYQIISFDVEQAAKQAFLIGRNKNFFLNLKNKIIPTKKEIIINYEIMETEIRDNLLKKFSQFENPAKNAEIVPIKNTLSSAEYEFFFTVKEEKIGKIIDYEKGIKKLKENLLKLNNDPIQLYTKTDYPDIYKKECLNIENSAQKILLLNPLILNYGEKQWIINKDTILEWLTLKRNKENKIIVSFNTELIKNFVEEKIAPEINKEPVNALFKIENERVTEFQANQDGIKINTEKTILKIESEFINNGTSSAELIVENIKSEIHTGEINNLGINEIIGTGTSNFSGSPSNRRHNIKIGANSLNGLLIKPNEEFSLIKALGKIDSANGYLPELVIKGNETIPEYGGGLCQIGTTLFRSAIASGLPITARQNHSYRVSYYEPAGTDAAVYDPWPDVQFINDTNNYILIQIRFENDDLYFDFWGTKDNRIIEKTKPIIYNIMKPAPAKTLETLDLPIGEKKCTEHAHNGADAYFDYKVSYPDGEIKEKRFSSHYTPWQEVCLIGVEKLTEINNDDENSIKNKNSENATSTSSQ